MNRIYDSNCYVLLISIIYITVFSFHVCNVAIAEPGKDNLPFWECVGKDGRTHARYAPCDATTEQERKMIEKHQREQVFIDIKKEEINRSKEEIIEMQNEEKKYKKFVYKQKIKREEEVAKKEQEKREIIEMEKRRVDVEEQKAQAIENNSKSLDRVRDQLLLLRSRLY